MEILSNVSRYKNKIINLFLNDPFIVRLINPKPSECPDMDSIDVLLGRDLIVGDKKWSEPGHIFDYDFVDDTITQEKTFLFVDIDVDSVERTMFAGFDLSVYVLTSKSLVRLNDSTTPTVEEVEQNGYFAGRYGNRVDTLCAAVDRLLNGNSDFGIGDVTPAPQGYYVPYCPNSHFYGKRLKYRVKVYNEGGILRGH